MDPKRGYTPEKLKEMGLTHDLVLFDDNIRIPFYLKYPGCEPRNINTQISTYDVFPTILDLLDIPMPKNVGYDFYGKSLLNIINSKLVKISTLKWLELMVGFLLKRQMHLYQVKLF